MLDLLAIPGTWLRPEKPAVPPTAIGGYKLAGLPAVPARLVMLHRDGLAEWQYREESWSTSGHWKIVMGFHLSIGFFNPDPRALIREEQNDTFYAHLIDVSATTLTLREPKIEGAEFAWRRVK